MRVLVAFDKFKNNMSAKTACDVAVRTLKSLQPGWTIDAVPLTDGGEGFVPILTDALGGTFETAKVKDALGRDIEARYGRVDLAAIPATAIQKLRLIKTAGPLAIIGMAEASGMEKLPSAERDPWKTTTFGTGQLIRHASANGAEAILLGLGGSATNDCGVGALEALGVIAYGHDHQPVHDLTPARWKEIASLGGLYNVRGKYPPLRLACDVGNPLLGPRGATAVYGPQKGLRAMDFERFERAMGKMADRLLGLAGFPDEVFHQRKNEPGAGAAGGIGFGLRTLLPDTGFIPGADIVPALLRLGEKTRGADMILTGEGRFDASSLEGKGPGSLLRTAEQTARVWVFAGDIRISGSALPRQMDPDHMVSITPQGMPTAEALQQGPRLLEAALRSRFGKA